MAITRDKKQSLVDELNTLLSDAKMTAFAHYDGLTVADLQTLRRAAREQGIIAWLKTDSRPVQLRGAGESTAGCLLCWR